AATGTIYSEQADIFTVGAGYKDIAAALNNTDSASSTGGRRPLSDRDVQLLDRSSHSREWQFRAVGQFGDLGDLRHLGYLSDLGHRCYGPVRPVGLLGDLGYQRDAGLQCLVGHLLLLDECDLGYFDQCNQCDVGTNRWRPVERSKQHPHLDERAGTG